MYVIKLQFQQGMQEKFSDEEIGEKFAKHFGRPPVVMREEMGVIRIHSTLKLSQKKIRQFAQDLGNPEDIEYHQGDFSLVIR